MSYPPSFSLKSALGGPQDPTADPRTCRHVVGGRSQNRITDSQHAGDAPQPIGRGGSGGTGVDEGTLRSEAARCIACKQKNSVRGDQTGPSSSESPQSIWSSPPSPVLCALKACACRTSSRSAAGVNPPSALSSS